MNKVLMNIVIDPRNNERYGRGRGSNYNGRGGKENNFCFCTYCGRNNHIVDTCYHKYGFPWGYKFKPGATTSAHTTASVNAQKDVIPSEANFPNFNIQNFQEQ